jgi:hypothetical protein
MNVCCVNCVKNMRGEGVLGYTPVSADWRRGEDVCVLSLTLILTAHSQSKVSDLRPEVKLVQEYATRDLKK